VQPNEDWDRLDPRPIPADKHNAEHGQAGLRDKVALKESFMMIWSTINIGTIMRQL